MASDDFNLTMAEFKGRVIQNLKDISKDIDEFKSTNNLQHIELFKRLYEIEQNGKNKANGNPIVWIAKVLGMVK